MRCDQEELAAVKLELAHAPAALRERALQLATYQLADRRYIEEHPEGICVLQNGTGTCSPFLYAETSGELFNSADGAYRSISVYVVPNGIAKIVAHYSSNGPKTGSPHHGPRTITAPVINNIAVWSFLGQGGAVSPQTITWLTSSGSTVRTIYIGSR